MTPLLVAIALAPKPSGPVYHVAPNGSDANPGSVSRPFATIERARDAVRKQAAARSAHRPVTVLLRGGIHRLRATLGFGKADSGRSGAPVTFRAYPGERPVVTGAISVTGFRRGPGRELVAELAQDARLQVATFEGRRLEQARYPNRDREDAHGGRWAYVDGKRYSMYADSPGPPSDPEDAKRDFWQRNRPELTRSLRMRPDDARRIGDASGGQVSVFPRFNWSHCLPPIEEVEAPGRTLKLGPGSYYEIRPGDRYFVRGARSLLDVPGEWHWDARSRSIAWIPPVYRPAYRIEAARVGNLIEIVGCSDLTISGLTLEGANGSGVVLRNCARVRISGCTIRNLGDADGDGVTIEDGRDNVVVGCDIHHVGRCGIRLGGGEHFTLKLAGNRAVNNYIHHVGLVERGSQAIALTGCGNVVSHNLIHDIPHSAILMWGAKHTIELNRIRHTCLETEDAGAIGGGAIDWLSWQGVVIRYNRIEDTLGYGYDDSLGRWRSPYFAAALYPDWAASGVRILGNVLVRAPRACIMLHSGRDNVIENNVLVDGGESVCQWVGWTTATGFWSTMAEGWTRNYDAARSSGRWSGVRTLSDPRTVPLPDGHVMHGNVFRRNILWSGAPGAQVFRWETLPHAHNTSDANLVWSGGRPIRTGEVAASSIRGPNLLANPGLEEGASGAEPERWAWSVKATGGTRIEVAEGEAHSAKRALRIAHEPGSAPAGALTMVAPGRAFPFRPGATYRFEAWLRTDADHALVQLEGYTWKQGVHSWVASRSVKVGSAWTRHRIVFRLPEKGSALYRPTMDTFFVRMTMAPSAGTIWVDDVGLHEAVPMDEWTAWKALGHDRRSVVADPRFVNAARGDYRLRPDSPALKLGFAAIPFEKIGPYKSAERASWPIREAEGARETIARRERLNNRRSKP